MYIIYIAISNTFVVDIHLHICMLYAFTYIYVIYIICMLYLL